MSSHSLGGESSFEHTAHGHKIKAEIEIEKVRAAAIDLNYLAANEGSLLESIVDSPVDSLVGSLFYVPSRISPARS